MNRLSTVQENGDQIAQYRYNALGQRTEKIVGTVDTTDYAALAEEQEALAVEYRAQAADNQALAHTLEAQADQYEQQAADNQAEAETLRTQAEADRQAANTLQPQIDELEQSAQPWVDRADRFRDRLVEPPQNRRDEIRNTIFSFVASIFQAFADVYLDQAESLEAQQQALRDSVTEKEQQADSLEAEAGQLLADAEQARQDAEALRTEADELIALAEQAEAQAEEYRELAENPPLTQEITLFVYDQNGQLIGEYSETGEPIREYVYLNGQPLVLIGEQDEVYYVHTDHLGTPKKMTDQNQAVVWKADYTPFGRALLNEDLDGDGTVVVNNLRFPGQYLDKETKLRYNHFRYYDPDIGRYITSDPIGLRGGINTYIYVGGNSIKWFDKDGLRRVLVFESRSGFQRFDLSMLLNQASAEEVGSTSAFVEFSRTKVTAKAEGKCVLLDTEKEVINGKTQISAFIFSWWQITRVNYIYGDDPNSKPDCPEEKCELTNYLWETTSKSPPFPADRGILD